MGKDMKTKNKVSWIRSIKTRIYVMVLEIIVVIIRGEAL